MGRVNRYKKYKTVDPFHKQNVSSHSEEYTDGQGYSGKRPSKARAKSKRNSDFDNCPANIDFDQSKKLPILSHQKMGKKKKRKEAYDHQKEKLMMKPGESRKQYLNRLDREVGEAMHKAAMDMKSIRQKRKQHLKERDKKKKESKRGEQYIQAAPDQVQDNPRFGEVVQAPPTLTLPRKASEKTKNTGSKLARSLEEHGETNTIETSKKRRKLMTEEQKGAFDLQRNEAIMKYRALKARTEFLSKT